MQLPEVIATNEFGWAATAVAAGELVLILKITAHRRARISAGDAGLDEARRAARQPQAWPAERRVRGRHLGSAGMKYAAAAGVALAALAAGGKLLRRPAAAAPAHAAPAAPRPAPSRPAAPVRPSPHGVPPAVTHAAHSLLSGTDITFLAAIAIVFICWAVVMRVWARNKD